MQLHFYKKVIVLGKLGRVTLSQIIFQKRPCRFSTLCDLIKHKLTSSQFIFIVLRLLIYESNNFYEECNDSDIASSPYLKSD